MRRQIMEGKKFENKYRWAQQRIRFLYPSWLYLVATKSTYLGATELLCWKAEMVVFSGHYNIYIGHIDVEYFPTKTQKKDIKLFGGH
jgi:hypothetical protein